MFEWQNHNVSEIFRSFKKLILVMPATEGSRDQVRVQRNLRSCPRVSFSNEGTGVISLPVISAWKTMVNMGGQKIRLVFSSPWLWLVALSCL